MAVAMSRLYSQLLGFGKHCDKIGLSQHEELIEPLLSAFYPYWIFWSTH